MEAEPFAAPLHDETFAVILDTPRRYGSRCDPAKTRMFFAPERFDRIRDPLLRDPVKMERNRVVGHAHPTRGLEVTFYSECSPRRLRRQVTQRIL